MYESGTDALLQLLLTAAESPEDRHSLGELRRLPQAPDIWNFHLCIS